MKLEEKSVEITRQSMNTNKQKIQGKSSRQKELSSICVIRVPEGEDRENISTVYLKRS